jgi:hypothetical protein
MGELFPSRSNQPDRSDPKYLEKILEDHFAQTDLSVFGVHAGLKPPESFEELQEIADRTRNPDCDISEEIDAMVEAIGALPDRDDITRRLPYDPEDGFITLIVPRTDI